MTNNITRYKLALQNTHKRTTENDELTQRTSDSQKHTDHRTHKTQTETGYHQLTHTHFFHTKPASKTFKKPTHRKTRQSQKYWGTRINTHVHKNTTMFFWCQLSCTNFSLVVILHSPLTTKMLRHTFHMNGPTFPSALRSKGGIMDTSSILSTNQNSPRWRSTNQRASYVNIGHVNKIFPLWWISRWVFLSRTIEMFKWNSRARRNFERQILSNMRKIYAQI